VQFFSAGKEQSHHPLLTPPLLYLLILAELFFSGPDAWQDSSGESSHRLMG
jgi:hypothetical protein